jgi:hypothetical protein
MVHGLGLMVHGLWTSLWTRTKVGLGDGPWTRLGLMVHGLWTPLWTRTKVAMVSGFI